ncbi:MAG TPA: glycosyltransferase 87 family protein, partial [Vicinamibacteria bacterium]
LVPVVSELQEGQTNLLVVTLAAAGLLCVEQARPGTGGLLLAAAAHVKVLPAVIVLPLLAAGRRRAAAWMLAGGVLLALLPALWTVPRLGLFPGLARCVTLEVEFARRILGPALSSATVAGARQFYVLNNSLPAVAHRLFGRVEATPYSASVEGPLLFSLPPPWLMLGPVLASAGMLVAALLLSRRAAGDRRGRIAGAALALVAFQIGALNFWEHHLVSMALLVAPLAAYRMRLAVALSAPLILALTAPYLLQHAPLGGGADLGGRWIVASRTWGAPTAAVLVLWAGCFAVYWREPRPVRE